MAAVLECNRRVCKGNKKWLQLLGHVVGVEGYNTLVPYALAFLWRQRLAKAAHDIRQIMLRSDLQKNNA